MRVISKRITERASDLKCQLSLIVTYASEHETKQNFKISVLNSSRIHFFTSKEGNSLTFNQQYRIKNGASYKTLARKLQDSEHDENLRILLTYNNCKNQNFENTIF